MAERPMNHNRFALPFAAWELRLYLDTHPDDERALAVRVSVKIEQGMMAAGTDSSSSCPCGGRWNWIDDPWPWDPAANHVESED